MAHLVWERFGDVPNYVEPFAGSLAVLLGRPTEARIETVNDLDCYLANFWRALQADPEELARWADWPVNEADLHARHRWLVGRAEFRARMREDPTFYDVQIAGWWVWGISQWIGGGWCTNPEWTGRVAWGAPRGIQERTLDVPRAPRPTLGKGGHGVHSRGAWRGRADGSPSKGGTGVGRFAMFNQIPDISGSRGAAGRGVHASARTGLLNWFEDLASRLRRVRVCCGDWHRILGPSPTFHIGTTGVFLDPPYSAGADRDPAIYGQEDLDVAHQVREWALANGDNPKLRIALCGYEGEHDMPATWNVMAWKSQGGYGAQARARGRANRDRERIWFSPHCLSGTQPNLRFDQLEEGTL